MTERLFDDLSNDDCHKQLQADVAWLRMVWRHLHYVNSAIKDKTKSQDDRISNSLPDLSNAMTYIEDEIWRVVEGRGRDD